MFGKGSKSEHEAVMLDTPSGEFVLRQIGGNPFFDPKLHKLVGKKVICDGVVDGYTLFIKNCEVVDRNKK